MYLYDVGVSRDGVCSRIAVLANSYNDAMAEVEREGYTVTPAFDIRPMAYEKVLISENVAETHETRASAHNPTEV
jgi:hypothetical protein